MNRDEGAGAAKESRQEIPRESLTRLSNAVEGLSEEPQDPGLQKVATSLTYLADAIELLPNDRRHSVSGIREAARHLADSELRSASDAALLKKGLREALQALVTRSGPEGRELEYQRTVRALGSAVESIDEGRPLIEQHAGVAAAFRASTDTVFVAAGAEAPFGEAEAGNTDASGGTSVERAVEVAQGEVLALGQTDWMQAREASARALLALADVVAAADHRKALGRKISDIRFQAERVRYADALSFGRAGWIKAGLLTALDALEELQLIDELRLSTWTRPARRAASSIQDRHSLSFQRAAVQDAFRATVDAFVAAMQPAPACR